MVEHIQAARDIDFQRRCNVLRFFFLLTAQLIIKVLQNRHIFRLGVTQIVPINHTYTAVDNGFLYRHEAVLTAHDQLT